MESEDDIVMQRLDAMQARNSPEVCLAAYDIALKLLANIVANPHDPRFRSVKKTNKTIQTKLLPCTGVLDLFAALGFTPMDDALIFVGQELGTLELAHALIEGRMDELREAVQKQQEEEKRQKAAKRPEEQKTKPDYSKMSEEKRRLLEQFENDRREANSRQAPAQGSRANPLSFGANQKCFKDIGVDINKKGG